MKTFVSNNPSSLVSILPETLGAGTYYIVIKTLYTTGGTQLKSLRTIVSDFTVTIG